MENIGEKNCNDKELARQLVGSIHILLELKQWNTFTKLQAINDPWRFVEEVSKHADEIEKESTAGGPYRIVIKGVTPAGAPNKIATIKLLREIMGWGLADSKYAVEKLPGSKNPSETTDYHIITGPEFNNYTEASGSKVWSTLAPGGYFILEVKPYPYGTPATLP